MNQLLRVLCLVCLPGSLLIGQTSPDRSFTRPSHTNTPYGFIENKGQLHDQHNRPNPSVRYLLPLGNGLNVQLRSNGFAYDTYTRRVAAETGEENTFSNTGRTSGPPDVSYTFHRVDIEFPGASLSPPIVAEEPGGDYLNYFNAVTPEGGVTHVRHFRKITYREIYPGIDLEFVSHSDYQATKPVEYNFVVHPGADASVIRLRYVGAHHTRVHDGSIVIRLEGGELLESIPASYMQETGDPLNVQYRRVAEDVYSFTLSEYDRSRTLVIDPAPTLLWGTYSGGSNFDAGGGVAIGESGNIVCTGWTASTSAIATSGSHQSSYGGGGYDAYVVKFNITGVRQWGTYYGGAGDDYGEAIAADSNGNIFVTGRTSSTSGIATAGAHQTTFGGGFVDAFIVKLTSAGGRDWGTYYGGTGDDNGYGVATIGGSAVVTGYTNSTSAIATPGAHQTSIGGGNDAFLVRFAPTGERMTGSYYGGTGTDWGYGIGSDDSGNVVLAGRTSSPTAIATAGAHQTLLGGANDAFIVKFSGTETRQWGTYYGGSVDDIGHDIAVGANGDIAVTGYTRSTSGIATPGAHQTTFSGLEDAFVVKFNRMGERQWGTYYGGSGIDEGFGVAITNYGHVVMGGYTQSANGISTPGTHQPTYGGNTDGFVVKFNGSGERQWGTYYGGNGSDAADDLAIDANAPGVVMLTGYTTSTSAIATAGGHQSTYGGAVDAFVARLTDPPSPVNGIPPLPETFSLSQNYPNPFNPTTEIRYQTPEVSHVTLKVFDILGREVATLVNELKAPGSYEITWNAEWLASGVYLFKLQAGGFVQTRRLVLLR